MTAPMPKTYHWFTRKQADGDKLSIVDFEGMTIAPAMDADEAQEIVRLVNFNRDSRRAKHVRGEFTKPLRVTRS